MSRALVSVAIPTAGRPSWVRRCVESLLAGDNLPHEIALPPSFDALVNKAFHELVD